MTRLFAPKAPRPPDHELPAGPHRAPEMSLKDAKGRAPPSPPAAAPVLRSHSFGGMSGAAPAANPQVLGQAARRGARPPATARHHSHHSHHSGQHSSGPKAAHGFHALRKSPKVPKKPRPNRALLMFDSIKNGVR